MTFYQLAFRYIKRKWTKSILLFLVLLFVSSMILSTSMILSATQESKSSMQEKTKSKVVIEISNENKKITDDDIKQMGSIGDVASINRMSSNTAFSSDFNLVTSNTSNDDNVQVRLLSYDDLKNDSPFYEEQYRLTSGEYIASTTKNGVVINQFLAEANGLTLNDEINFESKEGKNVSAKIIGIYLTGSERKQIENTNSVNRIENQIFMDNNTFSELFGNSGFYKVAVYSNNPENLVELKKELAMIVEGKAELTTSDILYKQMAAPLDQIIRVTKLMFILTLITGVVVVSLLLCMWMRGRQKETAILASIGKKKFSIFLQILMESFLIFLFATFGSCVVGSYVAGILQNIIINSQKSEVTLTVLLQLKDILLLLGVGGFVVLIAVVCSLIPILRVNPKDILSRMEG
ncbi:MAG: FtsX-like permease family protein [Lachnospiraceae bacterium]|nr:FtsX-like permease family protein [Lachnospiraceae bacterium]